jgi:hypothetical protein
MELTSATSRSLLLGEIAVELTGYEGNYYNDYNDYINNTNPIMVMVIVM